MAQNVTPQVELSDPVGMADEFIVFEVSHGLYRTATVSCQIIKLRALINKQQNYGTLTAAAIY